MTVNIEHACVYQIYMHELVWRSGYQRNRVLGLRTPAEINRQEHKADGLLDGKENISLSHKHKDIGSVVENNHIIILTLKANKICLSAKYYSDESGAKLITILRHLLLDAGRFICLIKSATCASVSSYSRWLPKEFLRLGYWSWYIILLGTALLESIIVYSLYATMELSKERKLAELAKG